MIKSWLLAFRLKTLTAALVPILVATALVRFEGYDLNYTGVIFEEEIVYNEAKSQIEIDPANYYDINILNFSYAYIIFYLIYLNFIKINNKLAQDLIYFFFKTNY